MAALGLTLASIAFLMYEIQRHYNILDDDNTTDPGLTDPDDGSLEVADDTVEFPDELKDFMDRDAEDVFRDVLPMPSDLDQSGNPTLEPAPSENQSVGTTAASWADVTDSVVSFTECLVGAENCPGEFEQGSLSEPPDIANGATLGAPITTGIAKWQTVTYLLRGSSSLTQSFHEAAVITDINNSHWSSGWQGLGVPVPPQWIGPREKLGDSQMVAGYEIGFAVHVRDLIVVSAEFRTSGSMELVIQDKDAQTIASLAEHSVGNPDNAPYGINQSVMLNPGTYRLRLAVNNNEGGPAVFSLQGTLASTTPHNVLVGSY